MVSMLPSTLMLPEAHVKRITFRSAHKLKLRARPSGQNDLTVTVTQASGTVCTADSASFRFEGRRMHPEDLDSEWARACKILAFVLEDSDCGETAARVFARKLRDVHPDVHKCDFALWHFPISLVWYIKRLRNQQEKTQKRGAVGV